MTIVKRSSMPKTTKAENRGERANSGVGDVSGSESGAGGSGGPEEYDSDPQAGGGTFPPASAPPKGDGADAPNHGSL